MREEHTEVLIAGAGPVGLSAALFLARQGIRPIVIEKRSTISQIPRATGVHSRTLELFRTVGLESAFRAVGLKFVNVGDMDVAEVRAGRATPLAMYGTPSIAALNEHSPLLEQHDVQYYDFTPCWPLWCGQDHYEPILLGDAREHGADIRFDTEVVSVTQDEDGVTAVVADRETGKTSSIRAGYLIGADGARSTIRAATGIGERSNGIADYFVSIIFRADIDVSDKPPFTFLSLFSQEVPGLVLFIEPGRWMIGAIYYPDRGQSPADFTPERAVEVVRTVAGDPDLEVEIESINPWEARHMVADRYRSGRIFLAGDAAHCHPPAGGFGVNAGVQDVHNLAWKLAAVLKGWAGAKLLDSYEAERRPVGVVTADQAWLLFNTRARRLTDAERRQLSDFIVVATGYRYPSGAVHGSDPAARVLPETLAFDGSPGSMVPHGWFDHEGTEIATLDLLGGGFVFIAGSDASGWFDAAVRVAKESGVPLRVHRLGPAGDLVPRAGDGDRWAEQTGISRAGAVLVRPDGFVAWREARPAVGDADAALSAVLRSLVGQP
jgi:2-polyprenyl-6-methoxyphenol hydroxylase-like FAD-dependent oxidoreductase